MEPSRNWWNFKGPLRFLPRFLWIDTFGQTQKKAPPSTRYAKPQRKLCFRPRICRIPTFRPPLRARKLNKPKQLSRQRTKQVLILRLYFSTPRISPAGLCEQVLTALKNAKNRWKYLRFSSKRAFIIGARIWRLAFENICFRAEFCKVCFKKLTFLH